MKLPAFKVTRHGISRGGSARNGSSLPGSPPVNGAAPPALNGAPASNGITPPDAAELRELRAQRDRLRERFTIMQTDLGGAFYEMAIRDHVRMDVLTRKAAELQRVDAELVVFERILKLQNTDAAGICSNCEAPFHHGQQFCAQCGHVVGTQAVR